MIGTKHYFEKITANQHKLVASFNDYANMAVEAMVPGKELAEKGTQLFNEFVARPYELADEMTRRENLEKFQSDFWGAYSEQMTKSAELSAELYRKGFEFMKEMWGLYSVTEQQERMRRLGEAVQNVAKVYTETVDENAKIAREYLAI